MRADVSTLSFMDPIEVDLENEYDDPVTIVGVFLWRSAFGGRSSTLHYAGHSRIDGKKKTWGEKKDNVVFHKARPGDVIRTSTPRSDLCSINNGSFISAVAMSFERRVRSLPWPGRREDYEKFLSSLDYLRSLRSWFDSIRTLSRRGNTETRTELNKNLPEEMLRVMRLMAAGRKIDSRPSKRNSRPKLPMPFRVHQKEGTYNHSLAICGKDDAEQIASDAAKHLEYFSQHTLNLFFTLKTHGEDKLYRRLLRIIREHPYNSSNPASRITHMEPPMVIDYVIAHQLRIHSVEVFEFLQLPFPGQRHPQYYLPNASDKDHGLLWKPPFWPFQYKGRVRTDAALRAYQGKKNLYGHRFLAWLANNRGYALGQHCNVKHNTRAENSRCIACSRARYNAWHEGL